MHDKNTCRLPIINYIYYLILPIISDDIIFYIHYLHYVQLQLQYKTLVV